MKTSGTFKFIIASMITFIVIALFSEPEEKSKNAKPEEIRNEPQKTASEEKPIDYSAPLYTTSHAVVCPISIIWDKREGYGIDGASKAAASVFGRSERFEKIGCAEWRQGIRIYVDETDQGLLWQRFSEHASAPADKIILRFDITN